MFHVYSQMRVLKVKAPALLVCLGTLSDTTRQAGPTTTINHHSLTVSRYMHMCKNASAVPHAYIITCMHMDVCVVYIFIYSFARWSPEIK